MMSNGIAAVIGLGAMGHQFGRHMVNKGFEVSGVDIDPAVAAKAAEVGVRILAAPGEVPAGTQCLIVMVATDKQVLDVLGTSGVLDRLAPGAVVCVTSSTAVETARTVERMCAEKGILALDTPVVLGQEAANNGALTIFCGGSAAAFAAGQPFLSAFGANVMHVGDAGMGQLCKTINNMLLWACITANYEALTFAKQMGADIPKMIEAMRHSSGANWALGRWGKSSGKWAEKDMDVALDMAQSAKMPLPLAALVDQLMKGMDNARMRALLD